MRCDQFEDRLQRLLDRRRAPERDSQLRVHAQLCPACRDILRLQAQLFDALDITEVPDLTPDFSRQVVARLQPSATVPVAPVRSHVVPVLLAVAASLVLGLFAAGVIWLSTDRGRLAQDKPQAVPHHEVLPSVAGPADGDNWWDFSPSSLATLYPSDVRQRHREQVETIADELKPIATPFTTAASALRRTIPVGKHRAKNSPQAAVPIIWPRDLS